MAKNNKKNNETNKPIIYALYDDFGKLTSKRLEKSDPSFTRPFHPKKKDITHKWVVYHKYRGYLSKNEEKGQYYSKEINEETYKFDREGQAYLLCDIYEEPVMVET